MDPDSLLALTRSILAQPTAPFHEDAVRAEIRMQLAQCPHVRVSRDDFDNIIAHYQRGTAVPAGSPVTDDRYSHSAASVGPAGILPAADFAGGTPANPTGKMPVPQNQSPPPRYAFAAHMDHPGFVGEEFLGGVSEEYRAKKPPTRDFGAFAMWDLPAFELKEGRIHSRACDDLIGCAAIVALFHELERTGAEASVFGLFTRAEEVGFVGAIQLAKSGLVPHEVTIVSLECSSERSPGAGRMGEGVIIRVGDKTSIFDDSATRALAAIATEHKIPHQRCLMSGGTCEATAYQLYGYRSAALCVALGNYHNCGPDTTIAPEFVSVDDVQGLIRLLIAASTASSAADPVVDLRARLEKRVEEYRRFF